MFSFFAWSIYLHLIPCGVSTTVARQLDQAGLDLIEVRLKMTFFFSFLLSLTLFIPPIQLSGGSYESLAFEHKKESTIKREGYFIEFAENIRPHLSNAALAVTGGFRSKEAMEKAVAEKSTDSVYFFEYSSIRLGTDLILFSEVIGLGRPLCAEPFFCKDILSGKITEARANKVVCSFLVSLHL